MQDTTSGGIAIESDNRNDAYRSVVSDLVFLIQQVRASLKLIESEIAREISLESQEASNVIVLDDVTPPYMMGTAALKACDANLGIALLSLLEAEASRRGTSDPATSRLALSMVRELADDGAMPRASARKM